MLGGDKLLINTDELIYGINSLFVLFACYTIIGPVEPVVFSIMDGAGSRCLMVDVECSQFVCCFCRPVLEFFLRGFTLKGRVPDRGLSAESCEKIPFSAKSDNTDFKPRLITNGVELVTERLPRVPGEDC